MVPFLGHEGNTVIVLARLITVGALQEMGLGSTRERESKLFGMSFFFPKGRQESIAANIIVGKRICCIMFISVYRL